MFKKIILMVLMVLLAVSCYALTPQEVLKFETVKPLDRVMLTHTFYVDVYAAKNPIQLEQPQYILVQFAPNGVMVNYAYIEDDGVVSMSYKGGSFKRDNPSQEAKDAIRSILAGMQVLI